MRSWSHVAAHPRRSGAALAALALVLGLVVPVVAPAPAGAVPGGSIAVADRAQAENTSPMVFTVQLSGATAAAGAQGSYTLSGDTATGAAACGASGVDFVSTGGSWAIASGATSTSISVPICGDTTVEPNETFTLTLTASDGTTCGDCIATGTINNDDVAAGPSLTIGDNAVGEGNSGTTDLVFSLTRSGDTTGAVTATVVTTDVNATGGAACGTGVDYITPTTAAVVPDGQSSATYTVKVCGDGLAEPNETFTLQLTPTGASCTDCTATGQITNDDGTAQSVFVDDRNVPEGNGGGTTSAPITVRLSAPALQTTSVTYTTSEDTASDPEDFAAATGTVTFNTGESSKTFDIPVVADDIDEPNETVTIVLSNPINASCSGGDCSGQLTINDDDTTPALSISNATEPETSGGGTGCPAAPCASFVVTLSAPSGQDVLVDYATADGTAKSPADFTATSNTLTIPASSTTGTISVPVVADKIYEDNETFFVNLSSPNGATIADSQGLGTITDDDVAPTIKIGNRSVTEADSSTSPAAFTVTVTPATGTATFERTVTATAVASDQSAKQPGDYSATSTPVSFGPGGTRTTDVTVPVVGDTTDEIDTETFLVTLTAVTNATCGTTPDDDCVGVGTITDNDPLPSITVANQPVTEGPQGTNATMTFTASLSSASGREVRLHYATSAVEATAGEDFTGTSGDLVWAPGDLSKQFTVTVLGDSLDEDDETFNVVFSSPQNATAPASPATGTIQDDDARPAVSIGAASVTEGHSGTTTMGFPVVLSAASGRDVTATISTADGTAKQPGDYTARASVIITIPKGQKSAPFNVVVNGDTVDEANETLTATISAATNADIGTAAATGVINDDDASPVLSVDSPPAVNELNSGQSNLTFTVTLTPAGGGTTYEVPVTFDVATVDGTAKSTGTPADPADFDAITTTQMTFEANSPRTQTVTVKINGDTFDENNESFTLVISNVQNGTCAAPCEGTGEITDDDGAPTLVVSDVTVAEVNAGDPSSTATFAVTLSSPSSRTVTVSYNTADITAVAGADYAPVSGSLSFAPGETTKNVGVPVFGDNVNESNEKFKLVLSSPTNAGLTPIPPADPEGEATITDNDPVPVVTVADKSIAEGNSGTSSLNFNVVLSKPSEQTVKVNYATSDGSATQPSDYAAASGTLTFSPGSTSMPVSITINGDGSAEGNESFTLALTIPSDGNATCAGGDCSAAGTITNDDGGGPTVSINDPAAVAEGTNVVFTVTVSPTTQQIVVTYSTADGTAKAPGDYTARTAQTLTFPVSDATQTQAITVATGDDALDEADAETFSVNITNATNATVVDSDGAGTIQDNDAIPTLTIDDKQGAEASGSLGFTIALSAVSGRDVTVNVSTADGSAVAGSDYTGGASSIVIPAGTLSVPYGVGLVDDSRNEGTETLTVNLTGPTAATCSGGAADCSGTGTVTDDDPQPGVSVGPATVTEGTGGSTSLELPLTLSAPSGRDVSVTYSTAGGSGGTGATSPADFTGAVGATATIAAGSTTGKIVVPIVTDSTDETDETFSVTLTAADFATVGTAEATATINDDDGPSLVIGDTTVLEGSSGTATASFTVTLSAVSPQDVTFTFTTADGTATAGSDFVGITGGTGTITAGQLTTTVPVTVTGDVVDETDETFRVELAGVTDATPTDASGTGTITDDDGPTITIGDRTVTEGSSGTTEATFTVTLSAPSVQPVSMRVDTANGTATGGSDFTAITNSTLTIPAAATTGTIAVQVAGDVLDEVSPEVYTVVLSNPSGATILDGTGAGAIDDDDPTPSLSIADVTVAEGTGSTSPASFTVTLSAPSGRPVSVLATTAPGSATAPADYATTSGTINFAPGETSKAFLVPVVGDSADEPDESFSVVLSAPSAATLSDGTATGVITDDDVTVVVPVRSGYWLVGRRGDVYAFGDAQHLGNAALGSADAIDIEGTPDGNGYWILDTTGRVFSFGSAPHFGDMALQSGERATSISALPGGGGYWIFTNRGRAGAFGGARHFSDMSGRALNGPVIGSVATPSGQGYYMVATDGGIFAFGDAVFRGSMGGRPLNRPVVGLVPDPDGGGYWLDASDGGVFAFEAGFRGSMGDRRLNQPVIGMVAFGNGYLMVASDGGVFNFSDKPFSGSLGGNPPAIPIVNIAAQTR